MAEIVKISASDQTSATADRFVAQNCTDNHPSKAPAIVVSDELDCKETSTNNGQANQEFDSDEDFFSVRGESSSRQWSLAGSPELHKSCDSKGTFQQEPFSSESLEDHGSAFPAYKEVKLAEFFQDRHWKGEIAAIHSSPPIASVTKQNGILDLPQNGISRMPTRSPMINQNNGNSNLKSQNKDMDTYCCMPRWSPRRGSNGTRKPPQTRV